MCPKLSDSISFCTEKPQIWSLEMIMHIHVNQIWYPGSPVPTNNVIVLSYVFICGKGQFRFQLIHISGKTSFDTNLTPHYRDVIMGAMTSQIISASIVYSTVCSGTDKKTWMLHVTCLCEVTGEFPSQRTSDAGNVSVWWRHLAAVIDENILYTQSPHIPIDISYIPALALGFG